MENQSPPSVPPSLKIWGILRSLQHGHSPAPRLLLPLQHFREGVHLPSTFKTRRCSRERRLRSGQGAADPPSPSLSLLISPGFSPCESEGTERGTPRTPRAGADPYELPVKMLSLPRPEEEWERGNNPRPSPVSKRQGMRVHYYYYNFFSVCIVKLYTDTYSK